MGISLAGVIYLNRVKGNAELPPEQRFPTAPMPQFSTPDAKIVVDTECGYPSYKCRMDTYLVGALCDVNASVQTSNSDLNQGVCLGSNPRARP